MNSRIPIPGVCVAGYIRSDGTIFHGDGSVEHPDGTVDTQRGRTYPDGTFVPWPPRPELSLYERQERRIAERTELDLRRDTLSYTKAYF